MHLSCRHIVDPQTWLFCPMSNRQLILKTPILCAATREIPDTPCTSPINSLYSGYYVATHTRILTAFPVSAREFPWFSGSSPRLNHIEPDSHYESSTCARRTRRIILVLRHAAYLTGAEFRLCERRRWCEDGRRTPPPERKPKVD